MTALQILLIAFVGVAYMLLGAIIAAVDISNKEIVLPSDIRSDGYDWLSSWIIFLIRTLIALPFWIIGAIIYLVYKLIMRLLTIRGGHSGSN